MALEQLGTIGGIPIQIYDVVQIWNGRGWIDYAAIKNVADVGFADKLVHGVRFGGHMQAEYRIQRLNETVVAFLGSYRTPPLPPAEDRVHRKGDLNHHNAYAFSYAQYVAWVKTKKSIDPNYGAPSFEDWKRDYQ